MGNSASTKQITPEKLEEYTQLTYLTKAEIMHIHKLFKSLGSMETLTQRFPSDDIMKLFPTLRYNPFRESIIRVFSSEHDGQLSFEDIIDLCSAFSNNCPVDVRAAWAFQIFDLDGDNQLSLDDLIEAVRSLNGSNEFNEPRIDQQSAEYIAQAVLQEMDMDHTGSIAPQEFVHIVARMPEFAHTFRFMP